MMARDRLLLDVMVGKLATYLRMCGYDAAYALEEGVEADDEIRRVVRESGRRLVTRDVQLAQQTDDAVTIEAREIENQLRELAAAGFDLALPEEPARCSNCNTELVAVDDDEPTPEYAPDPAITPVWRCPACGQHFWRGSHWDNVAATLSEID